MISRGHQLLYILAWLVIAAECLLLAYYHLPIYDWFSHNLWVVIIPFLKGILKRIIALKLILIFKGVGILLFHLSKLLLLKLLKMIGLRYGLFFSQHRWRWIRKARILFLRRGKQIIRTITRFWQQYQRKQKIIILVAFFPIGILAFFLGFSFNVTRKTMVNKTQETALFRMAANATIKNNGISAWLFRLDQLTLQKIRAITIKIKIPPK